ncbi:hypothetical protein MUP95_06315 [bacterium]|nr:hypothetical protein [bacterium]
MSDLERILSSPYDHMKDVICTKWIHTTKGDRTFQGKMGGSGGKVAQLNGAFPKTSLTVNQKGLRILFWKRNPQEFSLQPASCAL